MLALDAAEALGVQPGQVLPIEHVLPDALDGSVHFATIDADAGERVCVGKLHVGFEHGGDRIPAGDSPAA